jgi:trehalose 6-phosphate phosphatase
MFEVTATERVDAALRAALDVLQARPAALITDIDGTISRIVARPEEAAVSDRAKRALARLSEALDLVAVVTAREEGVARRLVGLDGLTYVGNYGLFAIAAGLDELAPVKAQAQALLGSLPCIALEEKGVSFALHYRNCDDPEGVRLSLLDALVPALSAAGARLLEGKMVVEVVPAGLPDKGAAVAHLAQAHGINGTVYLGDDLSDVAVFEEIARRRATGLTGLSIAVIDAETDARVAAGADLHLDGVDELETFLERLADAFTAGGAS